MHSGGAELGSHAGLLPGFPVLSTPASPPSRVALFPIWLPTMTGPPPPFQICVSCSDNPPSRCLNLHKPPTSCMEILWSLHPSSQLGSTSGHWLSCCPHPRPDLTQLGSGCSNAQVPACRSTPLMLPNNTVPLLQASHLGTSQPQARHAAISASQLQFDRKCSARCKVPCRCCV